MGCAGYAFVRVSSLFGEGIQAWGLKKKSHDATVRVFLSRVRNLVAVAVEVAAARGGQNAGARPATESKRADSRSLSAPASAATADLLSLGG